MPERQMAFLHLRPLKCLLNADVCQTFC